MPRDVFRDALYSGRINLWVEDKLTYVYLGAIWNDPAVKILIGGGHNGVLAILEDAEQTGYRNVFGVTDRDFGHSNYQEWFVPGRTFRRFILPRHEIENYLLDTPALEGCRFNTYGKSAAEIDAFMNAEAARVCWWSACRQVVSHIRRRFYGDFMTHPRVSAVTTEAMARDYITRSRWFITLPRKASGLNQARIHRLLSRAHTSALSMLHDGKWRSEYSGKEILRAIGSRICNRAAAPNYRPSPSEFDADLAKDIAAWQAANGKIPTDLIELLDAMKARIEPPPPAP